MTRLHLSRSFRSRCAHLTGCFDRPGENNSLIVERSCARTLELIPFRSCVTSWMSARWNERAGRALVLRDEALNPTSSRPNCLAIGTFQPREAAPQSPCGKQETDTDTWTLASLARMACNVKTYSFLRSLLQGHVRHLDSNG